MSEESRAKERARGAAGSGGAGGNIFERTADFLIYSNLFIALCALGYTLSAYVIFDMPLRLDGLAALSFGGTLALYLALRLHSARQLRGKEFTERLVWVDRNRSLSWVLFGTGVALAIKGLIDTPLEVWIALAPAALFALLYGLPFLPLPPRYRLRHRNYLKIFLIAGVWAWMASVLPYVLYRQPTWSPGPTHVMIPQAHAVWLFVSRFLFVVGITLPFDIRDIETDRVFHLSTVPMALGVPGSILLSRILLFSSWVLLLPVLGPQPSFWLMGILVAFTIWTVGFSATTKNEYLYLGWLDGTMLLQLPVLLLGQYLVTG